jgi:outer membrane immunogenic protein
VKNLLLTGIALVALAAPAAAADMPIKAPAPVAIDIWTGGYVGANVGYDWGSDVVDSTGSAGECSTTAAAPGCVGATPNVYSTYSAQAATFQATVNHSGVIYGGQAGHNWLVHNMFWTTDGVLGVEVDFQGKSDSHSNTYTSVTPTPAFPGFPLNQTATLTEKLSTLGTLRGRAGILWGPSTLIYATAGVAFASATASASYLQGIFAGGGGGSGPYSASGQVSTELFGPVIGGGVEWKWTSNLSIKAEYLYADLGGMSFNTNTLQNPFFGAGGGLVSQANVNVNTHVHDNIARLGVNWKLW